MRFLWTARVLASGALLGLPLLSGCSAAQECGAQDGNTSRLWGAAGELWDPRGRLPDFSYAGYHSGEAEIPEVPVVADVKDFGAVGDGITDDTEAFKRAIAATRGGALLIPFGRYVISDVLRIQESHIVLRGEDRGGGSTLYFKRSLSELRGPDRNWSWSGGLLWIGHDAPSFSPIARVIAPAARGDDALQVDGGAGLSEGQLVALRLLDDGSGGLGRHLHAEQAEAGHCDYQVPLRLDWPVRLKAASQGAVRLGQPLRTDIRREWSPTLATFPAVKEVGIERLRIELPDVPYAGHLKEPGYNAIFLSFGVVDGWIRDVTIANADSGILTSGLVKNVTVRDVTLEGRMGHHGISLTFAADVLVDRFVVRAPWVHALTVSHRANGNVFSRGIGLDSLSLDHHRDAPFENLFTEVFPYDFRSSGSGCAGPHAAARNTYWNLGGIMDPPEWAFIQTNIVDRYLSVECARTPDSAWYEGIPDLTPANLYDAQLARRLRGAGRD